MLELEKPYDTSCSIGNYYYLYIKDPVKIIWRDLRTPFLKTPNKILVKMEDLLLGGMVFTLPKNISLTLFEFAIRYEDIEKITTPFIEMLSLLKGKI